MIAALRWPTLSEWGLFVLMVIVFFVLLFAAIEMCIRWQSRRDVRKYRKDRSR